MALTTDFLVPVDPCDVQIFSVTSEVSGHEVEYAFDKNLNTYWKPTSTATQYIILDLQSAIAINGLALFVRNYDTDLGASATIVIEYSDTGTGGAWTAFTAIEMDITTLQTVGEPLIISASGTAETHRYWRIALSLFGTEIELSQLMLYRTKTVSVPNSRNEYDKRIHAHHQVNGPGGRANRAPINMIPMYERRRTWLTTAAADLTALQAVVDLSGGRENMLIHKPSSGDAEVIELRDKRFSPRQLLHQLWAPSLTFRTVVYIEDGEVF